MTTKLRNVVGFLLQKKILIFQKYYHFLTLIYRLGTPLCMDHFGWSEEETVLYFGILISVVGLMAVFLFASVGPLCKRFVFH